MFSMKMVSRKFMEADLNGFKFMMPICQLGENDLYIIGFDSMGKTGLIHAVAQAFIEAVDFSMVDYIVCPEAKAIPVAQEISRLLGIDYFVLRKAKKAYMMEPEFIEVCSITTKGMQTLWYDSQEVKDNLCGKRIALFDDVVSTGASYQALESFAEKNQLHVTCKLAALAEGEAKNRDDITVLGYLPLLTNEDLNRGRENV